MWGDSGRTACAELEAWESQEKLVPVGLEDGKCDRRLERKFALCVRVRSLDFILTFSIRKTTEVSHRGNQNRWVGLRKDTREVEEDIGGREKTQLVFCSD